MVSFMYANNSVGVKLEKMKTFKNLSIGDKIYYTEHPNDLLKKDSSIIFSFVIKDIKLGKDGENIYLNENNIHYSSGYSYALIIPKDRFDKTAMRNKDYHYKIYFTDRSTANNWIKQMTLEAITKAEKTIIDTKIHQTNIIHSLREKYHELLNSTYYKDFDIMDVKPLEEITT
jgi:hypothetical protein